MEYDIWRACERIGVLPPGVKQSWDDNGAQTKANIIEFDRRRCHDERNWEKALAGAK